MDAKYLFQPIPDIWSARGRFERMLQVEIANCEALHEDGLISRAEIRVIRRAAKINWRVYANRFGKTRHDVNSFVAAVAYEIDKLAKDLGFKTRPGRWVHHNLTSYDPWDTALAMQVRETLVVLRQCLFQLLETLQKRGEEHWDTVMIGRTHGTHAEPTTFGTQLANYWFAFSEHLKHLDELEREWNVAKISGPVGTHEKVPARIEEYIARRLGVRPIPIATQIIGREGLLRLFNLYNEIAFTVERVATNWRYQVAPEIYEVGEYFPPQAVGSSIMVHKRNAEVCERCCSLARDIAGSVVTARMNVLWLERDLSNSANERRLLHDTSNMICYIVDRLSWVSRTLSVHPARLRANLELTAGLVQSGKVMNLLVERGVKRARARELVSTHISEAWTGYQNGNPIPNMKEVLRQDPKVMIHLSEEDLDALFDTSYEQLLVGVQVSFQRLGWNITGQDTKRGGQNLGPPKEVKP